MLKEAEINLTAQGSNIKEIDEALKTASKNGKGNVGFPEYCGVVKDYVIVIEDKSCIEKQEKLDENGILDLTPKSVQDYALNGAYFYAKHILENTNFKKAFAFGISGNEKRHIIQPIYLDGREYFTKLSQVESFISFNSDNIDEYYTREVLKENTDEEKTTNEIIKDAQELHEYLRNYGNLRDQEKPLVVSVTLDPCFFSFLTTSTISFLHNGSPPVILTPFIPIFLLEILNKYAISSEFIFISLLFLIPSLWQNSQL